MASILKVDDLRGNTAAGNITITGEGGSATMQLQQGVAKVWAFYNGSGPVLNGSFNVSTLTDLGTGEHFVTATNALNSVSDLSLNVSSNAYHSINNTTATTTTFQLATRHSTNSLLDAGRNYITVHGDLA